MKLRVIFKSGHTEEVCCETFNSTFDVDGTFKSVSFTKWEAYPTLIAFDINEIAAVMRLDGPEARLFKKEVEHD